MDNGWIRVAGRDGNNPPGPHEPKIQRHPVRPFFERLTVLALGAVAILSTTAAAQTARRDSPVSGQNQFNSSSLNSGFGLSSGLGQTGFGQPTFGSTGLGNTGTSRTSPLGQSSAANRNTRQTGSQRSSTGRQNAARRSTGVGGMASPFGQTPGMGGAGLATPQSSSQTVSAVVVRISFATSLPPEVTVNTARVHQALTAAAPAGTRSIQVDFADGVATLQGTVSTAHEARLAAAVASLEPGVRSVRNLLQVEP